jgi:hypothetical protein
MNTLTLPDRQIQERLSEIASIFATGILRMRARNIHLNSGGLQNSASTRLEVSAETVLTVHGS